MRMRWALLALFTLIFLAGRMPVGLAAASLADVGGLWIGKTDGTIWDGEWRDVYVHGIDVQRVEVGLDPVDALLGRPPLHVRARSEAPLVIEGSFAGGGSFHALDLTVPISLFRGRGDIEGLLVVSGATAVLEDGRCQHAAGNVAIEAAIGGGPVQTFSGPLACGGAKLSATLAGPNGGSLLVNYDAETGAGPDIRLAGP